MNNNYREDYLQHYGVKGMKWDESKKRGEEKTQEAMARAKKRDVINNAKIKKNMRSMLSSEYQLDKREERAGSFWKEAYEAEEKLNRKIITNKVKGKKMKKSGYPKVSTIRQEIIGRSVYLDPDRKLFKRYAKSNSPAVKNIVRKYGRHNIADDINWDLYFKSREKTRSFEEALEKAHNDSKLGKKKRRNIKKS